MFGDPGENLKETSRLFKPGQRIFVRRVSVMLCVFLVAASRPAVSAAEQEGGPGAARHVIICVDGVGFSTIQKMRAEGRFKSFGEPSRMISPFPTLTNLAMTDILEPAGASETPGYEDNYFDAGANKLRGGVFDRLRGDRFVKGTFRELFDYHPSAIKSGLGYAAPPVSTYFEALSDLVRLRQKAKKARGPVFLGYTGATDSLAHLGGEAMLRDFLSKLDESITDIIRESRGPVTVTVFSDHGNHFRKYRRTDLKGPLRRAGFKFGKNLKAESSVVFPQFGLIGCALLFTKEENERRLAETASKVKGVEFVSFEKQGVVHVLDRDGEATIERRGERFRYQISSGDPLKLKQVLDDLTKRGKADAEGFASDADWFDATREHQMPDAVRRVFDGTRGEVGNPANVIVSFEDGYYSGSNTLDLFAFLKATHGNLGREQSFGFLMSTKERSLPSFIRAADVWPSIGSPDLKKSHTHEANAARLITTR